ncbi:hypothetical protein LTR64_002108 [Lithohypha guttulata]|uniref:uncharacterized protein n=1 Tax=Lithohypha guttulata TaxID=1690604 RepID=UPI002DE18E36|nr:hypothetical protein LTR51_007966 [Lithohypha guttulata]
MSGYYRTGSENHSTQNMHQTQDQGNVYPDPQTYNPQPYVSQASPEPPRNAFDDAFDDYYGTNLRPAVRQQISLVLNAPAQTSLRETLFVGVPDRTTLTQAHPNPQLYCTPAELFVLSRVLERVNNRQSNQVFTPQSLQPEEIYNAIIGESTDDECEYILRTDGEPWSSPLNRSHDIQGFQNQQLPQVQSETLPQQQPPTAQSSLSKCQRDIMVKIVRRYNKAHRDCPLELEHMTLQLCDQLYQQQATARERQLMEQEIQRLAGQPEVSELGLQAEPEPAPAPAPAPGPEPEPEPEPPKPVVPFVTATNANMKDLLDDPKHARPDRRRACAPCRIEKRSPCDYLEQRKKGLPCSLCLERDGKGLCPPYNSGLFCHRDTPQAYIDWKTARFESKTPGRSKPVEDGHLARLVKRQNQKDREVRSKIERTYHKDALDNEKGPPSDDEGGNSLWIGP